MRLFLLKHLLPAIIVIVCLAGEGKGAEQPVVWNKPHLDKVRCALPRNRVYRQALSALTLQCDSLLGQVNPCVTLKSVVPASGDKHDYISLARYNWPNPETADGFPYVHRDGETNPEVDIYDRNRMTEFADGVSALTVAYYLTDDARYGEKARDMVYAWFLDEATYMNPNLDYSQMIPGKNGGKGRHSGIIDMYLMTNVIDAVLLLEAKGLIPDTDMRRLRTWFSELVDWMLTAPNALKIAGYKNNLGVAYDAQLIRYALFAGRKDLARRTLEEFPKKRLAVQIRDDGSMPRELRRTKALSYSIYNIIHLLDVCDMARSMDMNVYDAENRAVERALRFLIPYLEDPDSFPYQQINERQLALDDIARQSLRAGIHSGKKDFRRLYKRFGARPENPVFTLLYR